MLSVISGAYHLFICEPKKDMYNPVSGVYHAPGVWSTCPTNVYQAIRDHVN
jgi:hypothetical protein